MSARRLTEAEIAALQEQGCSAADWRQIFVSDGFQTRRVKNTSFSGRISLGHLEGTVSLPGGIECPCGLYDSRVHDCSIADDVLVDRVGILSGYDIEEGAVVRNVGSLLMEGSSSFANGIRIRVLNESGGRELAIFDRLSAQIAYLLVMYRHNHRLVRNLESLIDEYAARRRSNRGVIGRRSRILDCGRLVNLTVGPFATIEGTLWLEEGTVSSSQEDPSSIGHGVIAREFIVLSGSRVESGAMLDKVFVGQGVRIGKSFSAENSAFFANCDGFYSEVVSVFAGPYSVTHHRATLLIACYLSFFNAGSGANQSNHMYKLGPLHQGVLERGVKTGSFSYLMWPARVGAFTSVMGLHHGNLDTSELPFSNLKEKNGISLLTPAVNLLNIGTRRDTAKWRSRDRRRGHDSLDLIHYSLLNPYTVGRIIRGQEVLRRLAGTGSKERDTVFYKGVQIRRLMLKMGDRYYELAVNSYLGDRLAERLELLCPEGGIEDIRSALTVESDADSLGQWRDLCGLLVPGEQVQHLVEALASGSIKEVDELHTALRRLYNRFEEFEWAWCLDSLQRLLDCSCDSFTPGQLAGVIAKGKNSALKLYKVLEGDAAKEFDDRSRIGFGIDGEAIEQEQDFKVVRGTLEENPYVNKIREESLRIEDRSSRLVAWLEELSKT